MVHLDPVQQRLVGVLIEKERTVPDTYPLTENALLAGCNQKSNRDPEMALEASEIHPAMLGLREDGWLVRIEGNRAARYRHRVEDRLNVSDVEMVVLAELLLRGPQSPGALKPRIARMGVHLEPHAIRAVLDGLARHEPQPLVVELPRRPRERDHRFAHLLGGPVDVEALAAQGGSEVDGEEAAPAPRRAPSADREALLHLEERVLRLEVEVSELRRIVETLGG